MSVITEHLPQTVEEINLITLADVIGILPETLDYPINVWVGDKLARYGQTSGNLLFLVEQDNETSEELKQYFETISKPYNATVGHEWKNEKISALRLYNEGRLIIDKETLTYKELPQPTKKPPVIVLDDVISKLPNVVNWSETIYLTGSLVRWGWSGNDVDFMVDSEDTKLYGEIRNYFHKLLGYKVDVGNADMPERAPVYKFKLYENRILQIIK